MSCCCCCNGGHEAAEPEPEPDPEPDPQPPRCTRYKVTIDSINVTDIDDGFLGGSLETDWTFVVNGQVKQWEDEDLDEGTHNIGLSFFVDVPADTSTITVTVSGVERDLFADDDLPGFTQVWGQAQDWGLGTQSRSASNSSITYSLNYSISCVSSQSVFAVNRGALTAYGQRKAEQRGVDATEQAATSWVLTRLQREGWDLEQASEDEYVFKGYGSLPKRIQQEFGRQ